MEYSLASEREFLLLSEEKIKYCGSFGICVETRA